MKFNYIVFATIAFFSSMTIAMHTKDPEIVPRGLCFDFCYKGCLREWGSSFSTIQGTWTLTPYFM
jgi:hypothetical protein